MCPDLYIHTCVEKMRAAWCLPNVLSFMTANIQRQETSCGKRGTAYLCITVTLGPTFTEERESEMLNTLCQESSLRGDSHSPLGRIIRCDQCL